MDNTQLINELLKLSHLTEDKKHLSKILFDAASRLDDLKLDFAHIKMGDEMWAWQGDGEDYLDSMTDGMSVMITAGDLKAIVDPAKIDFQSKIWCTRVPDIEEDDYDRAMNGV